MLIRDMARRFGCACAMKLATIDASSDAPVWRPHPQKLRDDR